MLRPPVCLGEPCLSVTPCLTGYRSWLFETYKVIASCRQLRVCSYELQTWVVMCLDTLVRSINAQRADP